MNTCPVSRRLATFAWPDGVPERETWDAQAAAALARRLRIGRRIALIGGVYWLLLAILAVLAADLGLLHRPVGDFAPLILSGWALAGVTAAAIRPRFLRRFPLPFSALTLAVLALNLMLMLTVVQYDHFGHLSAFGCLLGLVTMECYLGIHFGAWTSLLAGILVTLLIHGLYLGNGAHASPLVPEQEFMFVASALVISAVMAMANNFQRYRRRRLARLYRQQTEQTRLIRRQQLALDLRARELVQANERLRLASLSDGLTGVANRRCFDESLQREWLRLARGPDRTAQRQNDVDATNGLVLLLIDIDAFKAYNDRYGHVAGDECLRRVASAIQGATLRAADLTARYGGEEFVVLLPDTSLEGGEQVARRVIAHVKALQIAHEDSPVSGEVTVSVGLTHMSAQAPIEPAAFLTLADEALYLAKNRGRNRLMVRLPG